MALSYLIRSQNDAIKELAPACFTKVNYKAGYTNGTLSAYTPNGVLGGSVAAIGDDYQVVPADGKKAPLGLFINDAAGREWENNQALGSNKVTIAKGMASVEVDVYETHIEPLPNVQGTSTSITYAVGDKLYASAEGFLTNVVPSGTGADATVIGIVTKVPTTSNPVLGVDLRI